MSRSRTLMEEELIRIGTVQFSQHGYPSTTLDEIVSQAGISRVTFYTYFASKAALLTAIFEKSLSNYRKELKDIMARPLSRPELMRQIMELQIASLTDEPSLMRLLFREEANLPAEAVTVVAKMHREIDRILEIEVEKAIRSDEVIDEDPRLLVHAYMGMCNGLYRWYRPGDAINPNEIVRVFTRILDSGILTDKARAKDTSVTSALRQVEAKLSDVKQELVKVSCQLRSPERRSRRL